MWVRELDSAHVHHASDVKVFKSVSFEKRALPAPAAAGEKGKVTYGLVAGWLAGWRSVGVGSVTKARRGRPAVVFIDA